MFNLIIILKKKDDAYLMAFAAHDGGLYDFYICDELDSNTTYETIWFKCTLPHSHYVFIWRRDGQKFSSTESKKLRKYVVWDLDDDTEEIFEKYKEKKPEELKFPVFLKTMDNDMCTVLSLYEMKLPASYASWEEFKDFVECGLEEMESNDERILQHDKELKVYDGSIFKDMGLVPKKENS